MATAYRLGDLARLVEGRVRGDAERRIEGVATLEQAGPSDLGFLTNPKYRRIAETTRAGALLVARGAGIEGRDLLEVAEPYLALARILRLFDSTPPAKPQVSERADIGRARVGDEVSIGPYAVIEDGAEIERRAVIGPGCVVGRDCFIGEDSELKPRVVLYPRTRVGRRCLIHSGVVLGADGFGFATSEGRHHKIPQLGRVVVEDDVELGANTTVDRGAVGDTIVGRGSKIDNLVMIAHGVRLGEGALMAAQSGIAGSTRIGERATFAGQSGASGHLTIGGQVTVAAKSAVFEDLPDGAFVAGTPAVDHRRWKRSQALIKKLPELRRSLRRLESRLERLELSARGGPED